MSTSTLSDVAAYFRVADIPSATIPATRMSNILENIHRGRPLTTLSLKYLLDQDLLDLHRLAIGEIVYEDYVEAAGRAQLSREQAAAVEREAREVERLAREAEWEEKYRRKLKAAEAAREARESDPKYIAKVKSQALRKKYGMNYVDESLYPRMMAIIKRLDARGRLTEDDVVWLNTEAKEHFTDALRDAFHLIEANFFASEYERTQDPWNAVNASGHYRKCGQSTAAIELLDTVPLHQLEGPKIQSAVCTTRGGAMRDLGQLDEARKLGEQGHQYMPRDFRPCTLLGAVHMELGNFGDARDWYAKAEDLGASERSIDSDLRSIFWRVENTKREAMRAFLMSEDPDRYRWVNNSAHAAAHRARKKCAPPS
jgi:tetratricopeptide (TPR) repeat protein